MEPFESTYIGKLRKLVGHDTVVAPGSQVLAVNRAGDVFLQRRSDSGVWEIPAGACEPDDSFLLTAVREFNEETGFSVSESELVAFATISSPDLHTLRYPNGDVVRAFAVCFVAVVDSELCARSEADGEASDGQWFSLNRLPEPMHPPTRLALSLYEEFIRSGRFQAR